MADDNVAVQDRILSHMNQSHQRELTHYLRHYCGLSRRQAAGASLRDITFQGMRIRAGGADHVVHFQPPLQSWNEARPRVVEMDVVARRSLGISDVYMTTYLPPRPYDAVVMAAVSFYFVCVASLPWIVPRSPAWDVLTAVFPGGPDLFTWLVRTILFPVIGIHLAECFYLDRSRLQRHGVDRWSGLWWTWILSCFLEGFAAFKRFDSEIAKKRAQKEGKKRLT